MNDPFDNLDSKRKRKRKTKDEVNREFECVVKDCGKSYGFFNKLGKLTESTYKNKAH